jgi:putative chitinase
MIKAANLITKIPSPVMDEIMLVTEKFGITNSLRLSHFLSQCAHESGNFKLVRENLNYSADGLLKIFPKYFKDKATADAYARKPEKIANRVYANRMGNGDEASGDGFKYAGKGYIQLTGKDNYKQFSDFIGEDCVANPDLVATKYPLASAAFFFQKNKLWDICDKGATPEIVTAVTKRVNGGTHGLDDRLAKFNTFNSILA